MRELHVVATSEDGRHVVLATRKGAVSGDFRVAIDDRLTAAVRGDLPRPGETEPAAITPKEIQARLRAGESVEELAASAGVPVTKIERYAGPVLSERERVIAQARAGVVSRSRLGDSALPLGEAVDRHLADTTGVRLETVEWSARREDTGSWLVELAYVSQARRRSAIWRYDVARREVTATDAQSAALAHVEPGARRRTPEHVAAHVPAARPAARRSTPVRTAPKAASARTIAARPAPPVRAAAPVPKAVAAGKAAQTAADKAAVAAAARAESARVAARERAAKAAAAEAERVAAAAQEAARKQAAAAQARAAEERAAQQAAEKAAEKKAKAEAARKAKAEAEKKAKAEAARKAKAEAEKNARAEAERKAKAEAGKRAKAEAARKAKADAARKAKEEAEAKAEAARQAEHEAERAEAARQAKEQVEKARVFEEAELAREAETPTGPPTLRVVGGSDEPAAPARRGPKEPPAAARTAPARAAGQRASVPGWADVLLSTAPVARQTDPDPDED